MNYYQHHIGDFIRETSRLNDSQSMAYLRLIWIYYETEQPVENDINAIAFKVGASVQDVQQILNHFFFLHEGKWHQARCDKEILIFRGKSDKAKKSAQARWANADAMRTHDSGIDCSKNNQEKPVETQEIMRTHSERIANAPVLDANQQPITIINNKKHISLVSEQKLPATRVSKKAVAESREIAILETVPDIPRQVLEDFLTVRHGKNASEFTKTALALIANEAEKAGITTAQAIAIATGRGWQSFKAEWIGRDKTYAEKTQDYKDEQAAKFYKPLLEADLETLKKWGLA